MRCCGTQPHSGVGAAVANSGAGMPHVLFMLIYPSSIKNASHEKIEKLLYILINSIMPTSLSTGYVTITQDSLLWKLVA